MGIEWTNQNKICYLKHHKVSEFTLRQMWIRERCRAVGEFFSSFYFNYGNNRAWQSQYNLNESLVIEKEHSMGFSSAENDVVFSD